MAQWWADRNPDARTVVLLPDQGDRYLDTVYDDAWLDAVPARRPHTADQARQVERPDGGEGWTWMRWGRRRLADVIGDRVPVP